jgi:hypothetical protein
MTEETKGYLLDTNHCAYILNAKGKPENKQSKLLMLRTQLPQALG